MKLKRDTLRMIGGFLFALATGIVLGWWLGSNWEDWQSPAPVKKEVLEGQQEFINPLLTCGDIGAEISREIRPFKGMIRAKIDEVIKNRKAQHVSVYFRDLNNGPWFGIGEKELFSPASLLKIPLLMGWLKEAEHNPAILQKKIAYVGDNFNANASEVTHPTAEAEFGKTYTVEELLDLMIAYSDNNSTLLLGNSGWTFSQKVYNAVGLPDPDFFKGDYQITVKDYASFFRILYNASYLDAEMSNKALDLLASVDFKRGLVAGVPDHVKVAHKFGVRITPELKQMHDCGIVYYPKQPYLLCVMTKGADVEALISVVSEVSRLAYEEVNRQYSGKASN